MIPHKILFRMTFIILIFASFAPYPYHKAPIRPTLCPFLTNFITFPIFIIL